MNRPWTSSSSLYEQLCFASQGDAILLIEDAVLSLHSPINLASFCAKCAAHQIKVYAVKEDLNRRGVRNQYPQLEIVDYSGFVDLVAKYDKQVAW